MLTQGSLIDENQGLFSQLGFYIHSSSNSNFTNTFPHINDFKPLNDVPSSFVLDHATINNLTNNNNTILSSITLNPRDQELSSSPHAPIFSSHTSPPNLWRWGEENGKGGGIEDENRGVPRMKMKKVMKTRRKVREPRFSFKTMSDIDVLDDGYKWRKYGQKVVKNTLHPRSYYRCTQDKCRVKKRVERLAEDPRMVITSYEGRHAHSPSHDLDDSQATQPFLNSFFR